ncbi:PLP-dependent aminotransferase family protein [Cohaesibacter gelatinilyticus]|uniref:Transcriptional regulator, GntR family n=1 Tax=Cohaesibacter gelatinilyticus TaxID=372072 RepID=A0A285PK62_9HYPH|nr:PLP-dependent aminotransferase family protein [Cohaesibacter gelatinilyticus]SNZ20271.1 transcriptional regulator, GntR family [Cohaesibacter gelatinilyticus]
MSDNEFEISWKPVIRKAEGPAYLAIANALEADIHAGTLMSGTRLPPQRALARFLALDFTTISRAYNEASKRGLVEGKVGQGTYVRGIEAKSSAPVTPGIVDMAMNQPPCFDDATLARRMKNGMIAAQNDKPHNFLFTYQIAGGTEPDREAGVHWLSSRISLLTRDRLIVCPGAQSALLALVNFLSSPGEVICAEELTYPGFRSLATQLGIILAPIAMDEAGILPASFEEICVKRKPAALYLTPTLHNPTTITLPLERRQAIANIARRYHVPIIEDDAYGALPKQSPKPLAELAPELTYHVSSLSKCLSPALRIAYLVAPDIRIANRIVGTLRATACMASPLTTAIATNWIEDGTADAVLNAIRQESEIRQRIAKDYLPKELVTTDSEGFHAWLKLPVPWTRSAFIQQLRNAGVSVVGSDAFSDNHQPEAVRLGFGAPHNHEDLKRSLQIITDFLKEEPALMNMIV